MDEFESLAQITKALSDPTRLKLLQLLSNTPEEKLHKHCENAPDGPLFLCVNAMTSYLNVTQSAVSQHLRTLRQAGLVRSERRGSFVHYTLDLEGIEKYKAVLVNVLGDPFIVR
ncbi:MAG: helix-turn-helix transcriptional regulator [Anaerolineaceae bacterium]|nr:helix-turn-helix transcriptional regulator [Anaerolineaceae bacterium]